MGLLAALSNLRKKRSDSSRSHYSQIIKQQKMAIENQALARGQKTVIRHFTREDVDKWLAWPHHTDPLYTSSYPRPMSRLERDSWFSERSHRADYMMFAADDFQGNLVGLLTLRNIERNRSHAVLGITMRPEVLGGGLGTDSLWTFLSYYFNILHFDAMILDVAAYNRRAQRVYEKCGFIYTGDHWGHYDDYSVFYNEHYRNIREYFRQHGAWIETLYFDMILRRYDYEARIKQGYSPVKKG